MMHHTMLCVCVCVCTRGNKRVWFKANILMKRWCIRSQGDHKHSLKPIHNQACVYTRHIEQHRQLPALTLINAGLWISCCLCQRAIYSCLHCGPSLRLPGWCFQGTDISLWSFSVAVLRCIQGNAAGGTRAHVTLCYWWERGRKLTSWRTRLGLQLSWQEDSSGAMLETCEEGLEPSCTTAPSSSKQSENCIRWTDMNWNQRHKRLWPKKSDGSSGQIVTPIFCRPFKKKHRCPSAFKLLLSDFSAFSDTNMCPRPPLAHHIKEWMNYKPLFPHLLLTSPTPTSATQSRNTYFFHNPPFQFPFSSKCHIKNGHH